MTTLLLKMDMHNVFYRHDPATGVPKPKTVHRFMVPLIAELSKQRPTWHFVCESPFSEVSRFTIMEDGEELGWISQTSNWRTNEHVYQFDNHRLRAKRQRGSCSETKHLKTAVKTILGAFEALSPLERGRSAMATSHRVVSEMAGRAASKYSMTGSKLWDKAATLLLEMRDVFRPRLIGQDEVNAFDALDAQVEVYRKTRGINGSRNSNNGVTVLERSKDCILIRDGDQNNYEIRTLDELPPVFRERIAMLKLVEPGHCIEDVGTRATDVVYYLSDVKSLLPAPEERSET